MTHVKVVVPVHNEETMLPWFLRHYQKVADSIVVWDNGSDDATPKICAAAKVDYRTFQTEGYDEASVLDRLHETLDESKETDWVLFPDVDEFLVGPLREVLEEEKSAKAVSFDGYVLMGRPGDPPLDPEKELVGQRTFGYPSERYSKPIAVRPGHGIRFSAGKHELRKALDSPVRTSRVKLLHHEMVDFDLWVYRKTKRPLSKKNILKGWSTLRFCRDFEFYVAYWNAEFRKARKLAHVFGGSE